MISKGNYFETAIFYDLTAPPIGQSPLIILVLSSHSDTPHSVGLLWMSGQPDAETSIRQHNIHKRQTFIPLVGFKPTIPGNERPQTHVLDRADTGVGLKEQYRLLIKVRLKMLYCLSSERFVNKRD